MIQSAAAFTYPNENGMILQLAMEEILGREGVEMVVRWAMPADTTIDAARDAVGENLPFFQAQALQPILELLHGQQAGKGLALQIGRASFKHCLRAMGSEYGLTDPAFRLLPLPKRLRQAIEAFAGLFHSFTGEKVCLKQDNGCIEWTLDKTCTGDRGTTGGRVCMLAVGLLQEALTWLCAGRNFQVKHTCNAASNGTKSTITIDQSQE